MKIAQPIKRRLGYFHILKKLLVFIYLCGIIFVSTIYHFGKDKTDIIIELL